MNELVRDELIRIVRENGEDVLLDPVRTKAFLNDFCGNKYRREINSITLALKEGAATELLNSRRNRTERFAIARLSKNLEESFGFPKQQTIWTVESIAIALGVISQDETVEIESVRSSELERFPETKPEEARSPQLIQDEEKTSGPAIKVKKKRIALPLLGVISLLLILLLIFISVSNEDEPTNTPSNPTSSNNEANQPPAVPAANRKPYSPSNPGPSHNATNQPLSVNLSWDCSDPDGDAVTYDVYFGTNSNPTTKISSEQSGKTLSRSNLLIGTTYYWKVVAKDGKGATTEGPLWQFTTQVANRKPYSPSNPGPSHNATNQPLSVNLSWDCSDPDGDTVTYDVYFGTSADFKTPLVPDHSSRAFTKSNLSYNTTYYWKVVAKDGKGATTEGPVWQFTTKSERAKPSSNVPSTVLVEKGSFTIGDTWGDGQSIEKPTRKITFTYDFEIGKYEVTFKEYDSFCDDTNRTKPHDEEWGRDQRPVINVSWWDAIAYCNWLSEKEKLPKAYDNNGNLLDKDGRTTTDPSKVIGYRLPTEAEWEYAARGGNLSKDYKYAGSDTVDDVAWYNSNSGGKTQEVGKKVPNELGIYDMSGNVYEWCSDWYGSYSGFAQTNPYNDSGSGRIFRGGGWYCFRNRIRIAYRGFLPPSSSIFDLGFRICRTSF